MSSARYLELARQQKQSEGVLEMASLSRLEQALRELGVDDAKALSAVSVVYQIQGLPPRYFGDTQLPMLSLTLQTNLPLICQRCFAPMPQMLDVQFEFAVCDEPPEALLEDEDVDWLESSAESTFESLVEDELLMALPIAVMHEEECAPLQKTAGEKPNPFAALKNLKLDK
ncbi:MAG TPA: YceD family protein [Methylophilus sp.]|uniref:YceD family protein n=1 Tax=Methylophilus sp. TaxID=29541 RepID=UPI002B581B0E|nr:YceD family protein [Methylophilus sp.]HSH87477.1 YceD family protein [Methylophilus sp.]